jgi:hypothetical protein
MRNWWSGKFGKQDKQRNKEREKGNSIAAHIQAKNQVVTDYSQAMKRLQTTLTPEERYKNLVLTYRSGRDLLVVPRSWMGRDLVVNCACKKVYVDTPLPSIVRTR